MASFDDEADTLDRLLHKLLASDVAEQAARADGQPGATPAPPGVT
ncbi:hypothetical protein [Salinibacterium sp. ZJ450]|nr:hypothetical protein [Salinibacterium sp. ZJ450]